MLACKCSQLPGELLPLSESLSLLYLHRDKLVMSIYHKAQSLCMILAGLPSHAARRK